MTYTKNEVSKNWLPETTDFTHDFCTLPDRCGGMCRHPTGSRHFAAELALRSSLATGAAACVGTLRAAATLPPSWLC